MEEFIEPYSNGENQDPVTPAGKQVGESSSSDKPLLPPACSAAPLKRFHLTTNKELSELSEGCVPKKTFATNQVGNWCLQ